MSHIRDCPEFRLSRSDSKDPSTTCRGSRTDGHRCRRKIASKAHLSKDGEVKLTHAQFFCWQHQDQAPKGPMIAANSAAALKNRSSMDSLVERTGLLKVQDGTGRRNKTTKDDAARQRVRRHSADGAIRSSAVPAGGEGVTASAKSIGKKRYSLGEKLFRLITGTSDDGVEIRVRRRARYTQAASPNSPQWVRTTPGRQAWPPNKTSGGQTSSGTTSESPSSAQPAPRLQRPPPTPLPSANSLKPAPSGIASRNSSSTQYLMSWIPPGLSPETTSRLLQKLGEPLSNAEETGYIYIYCVTPPNSAPSPDAASSLIPPPSTSTSDSTNHPHRTGDTLQPAAIPTSTTRDPGRNQTRTITLKIGRAVNVSRRISQQCAHNLTLVRYYPYTPSTEGAPLPRKVPNIHRLERLIHIELADRRLKLEEPCEQCQKRHQEYFKIKARREQLQLVDECVRRWVEFSEENP